MKWDDPLPTTKIEFFRASIKLVAAALAAKEEPEDPTNYRRDEAGRTHRGAAVVGETGIEKLDFEGIVGARANREVHVRIWETLQRLVAFVQSHSKPALTIDAIAFAAGLHSASGKKPADAARLHGVSRQAFSKRCVRVCLALDLPPSALMRSKEQRLLATQIQAEKQRRIHQDNPDRK